MFTKLTLSLLFMFCLFGTAHADSEGTQQAVVDKQPKYADFVVRFFSQGGFSDNRSPEGVLGGGQLTLDVMPVEFPIGFSISTEYYTNSSDPTHNYEISDVVFANVLYMTPVMHYDRVRYFASAGVGYLKVPSEVVPDTTVSSIAYNIEAGVNVRVFWKIGGYADVKYLYANKSESNTEVIDFNEAILLLGLTFNFSL